MKYTIATILLVLSLVSLSYQWNGSQCGVCPSGGVCAKHARGYWYCRYQCRPTTCKNGGKCSCRNNRISCSCKKGYTGKYCQTEKKPVKAICILGQSDTVKGSIFFEQTRYGTKITGKVTGLPTGPHGFHVHAYGDATSGCSSFGGHYNPFQVAHGGRNDRVRHVGDLGNIYADKHGNANIHIKDRRVKLSGPFSVYGRGIVIHASQDDLGQGADAGSMATGNAGSRLACCVIAVKA